jgi:hypothetical protein
MWTAIFSAPLGRAELAQCLRKTPSVGRHTAERLAETIRPRLGSAPGAHLAGAAPRTERAQRRPEGALGVPHHHRQRVDAPRRALDARRTREGAPVAQKHARRGRRCDQQRAIPTPVAIILCGDAPAPRGGAQNREQRPGSARFLCACHAHPGTRLRPSHTRCATLGPANRRAPRQAVPSPVNASAMRAMRACRASQPFPFPHAPGAGGALQSSQRFLFPGINLGANVPARHPRAMPGRVQAQ